MLWKIIIIHFSAFLLISCQSSTPYIPADVIIENAHGGGSVVQFNKNETVLASGGWSGYIRLWNIPDGSKQYSWKAHSGEVTGIFFINNDKIIVSSGYDGFIKIWSSGGDLIQQINTQHKIPAMVIDEQDNLIITGHIDGIVRTWTLSTLSPLKQRKQHNSPVRAVSFSAHNKMIASSGSGGDTMLWPNSGPSIKLPASFGDIRSLTFAEKGQILLGGGWFNLYRWTLKDNKLQVLDTEHRGIIRNIELLDDDATLATISRQTDSAVLFINPKTGVVKQRFQAHELCGMDITVSKNQNFMATTSDDASVRLWWLNKNHPFNRSDSNIMNH